MRRFVLMLASLLLVSTLLPAIGQTRTWVDDRIEPTSTTGSTDVRLLATRSPSREALAAARALKAQVRDLEVTWDSHLGTAKLVFSQEGYLSAKAPGPAVSVARNWVAANRAMFGLAPGTVDQLKVVRDAVLPGTLMHAIVFRVHYGAVPAFAGGGIGVNVARDGRIVTAWANTGPTPASTNLTPKISAADALRSMAARERVSLKVKSLGQRKSGDRLAIFDAGGSALPHNVRLVVFPTGAGPVLAWRVFFAKAGEEMISAAVDARNGQLLFRHNQVVHAEGRVFENYPGAPAGGKHELVSFDGDPEASPDGWVGQLPTTMGNNIWAWADWTWPKLAPGLLLLKPIQFNTLPDYMPFAPGNVFDFEWTNEWGKACDPVPLPAEVPLYGDNLENPSYIQDRDASVTNIFFLGNRIHDLSYKLGFNEAMGNFQFDNFGKGGKAMDPVHFGAMLGIVNHLTNNAFFFPAADGGEPTAFIDPADPTKILNYITPFSGMFLWRPVSVGKHTIPLPCVDGDLDAGIAWHEYTHGITTRVAGGPDDSDSLTQAQAGAMGEAWSDWFALHFLHSLGLEKTGALAAYATGNPVQGIRNWALDNNPLTYADYGYDVGGPEVHSDGEIWAATLWDLRTALIAKHGKVKGAERAGHLVFDALTLAGMGNPSFVDMRNGILKADTARYKNEDLALIWRVFAKRGMGVKASAKDAEDVHPKPSFEDPKGANGTLSGVISDSAGGTLPAKVILGLGEGDPNPVAIAGKDGRFSVEVAVGTYTFTVAAPGYGLQYQGEITVTPAGVVRNVALYKNVASVGYGATVVSGVTAPDPGLALIDDHEFSGQIVTVGKPVVVKLAGNGPAGVRSIAVAERPAGAGTRALAKAYTVELSLDGKSWTSYVKDGARVAKPFFLIDTVRRVTKRLAGAGVTARFVRITVTDTFAGEPADGSPWTAVIGDLVVLGNAAGVTPKAIGGEPDFVDEGTIAVTNAGGGGAGGGVSVTENVWLNTCAVPPGPIQGLDGWIVELPDNAGDGLHKLVLTNKGGQATDLDVYLWNADCSQTTGAIASPLANEAGPVPAGSKWVLVILFGGTTTGFETRVSGTLERVIAPTAVKGTKVTQPKPKPKQSGGLPATGIGSMAALGGASLLMALGLARWRKRA